MSEAGFDFLIFGASGLVGTEIARVGAEAGLRCRAVTHSECDIASATSVRSVLAETDYDTVINCAAYNAVDAAEGDTAAAFRINRDGVANIAAGARRMVHYSTDFVFNGQRTIPYTEQDLPDPQSVYAKSKSAGDGEVRRLNARHFLLRVGCLYGAAGKGFGSTLLRRLRAGERIRADAERQIQPTWARHVALQTIALAQTNNFGTYHAMCHGQTTWAEFGREFAKLAGMDAALIDPMTSRLLGAPAARPAYAVLENRALARIGIDLMPEWRKGLEGYLAEALSSAGGGP